MIYNHNRKKEKNIDSQEKHEELYITTYNKLGTITISHHSRQYQYLLLLMPFPVELCRRRWLEGSGIGVWMKGRMCRGVRWK